MMKTVRAALAVLLLPASAYAETWTVAEGPQAKVRGTWTVVVGGGSITGAATMSGVDGRALTYGVNGEVRNGDYVVHRVKASDAVECVYIGKPAGNTITGNAICDGAQTPWIVTRGN